MVVSWEPATPSLMAWTPLKKNLALNAGEVLQRGGVLEARDPRVPRRCNVTSAATPCEALEESAVEQTWKAGHVEPLELDGLRKASWPT